VLYHITCLNQTVEEIRRIMVSSYHVGARILFALISVASFLISTSLPVTEAFSPMHNVHVSSRLAIPSTHPRIASLSVTNGDDGDDKFSFQQRLESIKCVVVGALSGGIAVTPLTALHDILLGPEMNNGFAQWEFDTDMGSLEAALFAIVYRYVVRTDDNPMLNQGAIGTFVLVRTLSRIRVPSYCSAAPLDCKCAFECSLMKIG
jgi:hypothetical protein